MLDIYGATECTGIIARSRLNELHPGTSGRVLPGLEWRLAQPRPLPGWAQPVGLLEVRGPTVAVGYLDAGGITKPLALTPDGWLATGDLACVDNQARVRLVGREKPGRRLRDCPRGRCPGAGRPAAGLRAGA